MFNAPSPPDPYAAADAQASANRKAALTQQAVNMTDQTTPDYTLRYQPSGTTYMGDGISVPRFEAITKLSPANQKVYDQTQGTKLNLATMGNEQSAKIRQVLNTPFNLDVSKGKYLDDMARTRLDPMWAQREQDFEQSMVDRGIHPGSQAYNFARAQFDQARTDAYTQMSLQGQAQANQAAFAERNQPLNEISALESGSQVNQPNFISTPQAQVAAPNVEGLIQQNYQDRAANANSAMGGLFGLGGTIGSAALKMLPFSDRRLKSDIKRIGTADNGLPIYTFRYIGVPGLHVGVMAQEAEQMHPDAVHEDARGFKMVDYERVFDA